MAYAFHRRFPEHPRRRLLSPLRLRSQHREQRTSLLHHGLLRLHRSLPNLAGLQRMDNQQLGKRREESDGYRFHDLYR